MSQRKHKTNLKFAIPSSHKQEDTSSEARSEAFDRWLENDYTDSYKLDNAIRVDHPWIYEHTRNTKCDHKLQQTHTIPNIYKYTNIHTHI